MADKLRQDDQITARDVLVKVQKLEFFIKRAERRLEVHEKRLDKLRKELKREISLLNKKVLA